jgi:hypothetical protein
MGEGGAHRREPDGPEARHRRRPRKVSTNEEIAWTGTISATDTEIGRMIAAVMPNPDREGEHDDHRLRAPSSRGEVLGAVKEATAARRDHGGRRPGRNTAGDGLCSLCRTATSDG